jgi:branched-chain amino acid transport system ATP-binding protein
VLAVETIVSRYGRIEALHGVSLSVAQGEIVTLIGSNGAGKTTLMRVISGILPMASGGISFDGDDLTRLPAHMRVMRGIAQVPEARQVFSPLSVADNLLLGGYRRNAADVPRELERVYALFPALAEKRNIAAGNLSGGQQQMLAMGRALMSGPRLLLLDEPSMGLAPVLVDQILDTVVALRKAGVTVLLVEQNVNAALAIADRAYVLAEGRNRHEGPALLLRDDPMIAHLYFGGDPVAEKRP